MTKHLWDKLAVASPINTDAALSVSKTGIHYQPPVCNVPIYRWDSCPRIKARPPAETDVTGRKTGKLTAIGLLDEPARKNRTAVWVVRCVCGAYEGRRARSITNPLNVGDECFECRNLRRLRLRTSPSLKKEARK